MLRRLVCCRELSRLSSLLALASGACHFSLRFPRCQSPVTTRRNFPLGNYLTRQLRTTSALRYGSVFLEFSLPLLTPSRSLLTPSRLPVFFRSGPMRSLPAPRCVTCSQLDARRGSYFFAFEDPVKLHRWPRVATRKDSLVVDPGSTTSDAISSNENSAICSSLDTTETSRRFARQQWLLVCVVADDDIHPYLSLWILPLSLP